MAKSPVTLTSGPPLVSTAAMILVVSEVIDRDVTAPELAVFAFDDPPVVALEDPDETAWWSKPGKTFTSPLSAQLVVVFSHG